MPNSNSKDYDKIIEEIFFNHYKPGDTEFIYLRPEIVAAKEKLAPHLDLNPGDVNYHYRFRGNLPKKILATQPANKEWIIELAGRSRYRFRLVKKTRIIPNENLVAIDIADATPEIIRAYALDDEQALLAILRYNRLLDTFLGLTTYSLQNHLRTSVKGMGQIEIDELYIGYDKYGCHYVIPVQAKGGKDEIGVVQTTQDIAYANQKFPNMRCRAISAQFMPNGVVALFDLALDGDEVKITDEKHYRLVPASNLDASRVRDYRSA